MKSLKQLCDRCEREIDGPYITITVNYHHPKTLDICRQCETDFTLWLGKHPLWGTKIEAMLEHLPMGSGYPTKEQIEDRPLYTKAEVRRLAAQCNCHDHVPDPQPCPLHSLSAQG